MAIDFNNAPEQPEMGALIPDGTVAKVHMTVRPGNAGDGGFLKRSKSGESLMLDCEFTIMEGPFAKRKFWSLFTLEGISDGHAKAADISASRLRAIIESAKGIRPDDESEAAKAGRRMSYGDFDGLRFVAKIGIEKAKEGSGFKDKNSLEAAITPDRSAWVKVEQIAKQATAPAVAAKAADGVKKPAWAS